MKITQLEVFLIHDGDHYDRNWVLVKIATDVGISGWGEAGGQGLDKICVAAIMELERYLVGKDPLNIEQHWQLMFRRAYFRQGPIINGAISGVEIALWDIVGKYFKTPIYNLLGGAYRHKIRMYTHANGRTPDELVESAKSAVKQGYTAVKFPAYGEASLSSPGRAVLLKDALERVKGVREAVGDNIDIMVGGRQHTPQQAIVLARMIEKYKPLWMEEPVPPENPEAMAKVSSSIHVPIAAGERLYTKYGFRRILELQAVDVVQPDLCIAGGILEGKKIAAMAEAYYVYFAPHNPLSPVSTAAAIQLDACTPNFLIQEHLPDTKPFRSKLLIEPLRVEKGYIKIPTRPGLGIEINEKVFNEHPYKPWESKVYYCDDGSLAGWPGI